MQLYGDDIFIFTALQLFFVANWNWVFIGSSYTVGCRVKFFLLLRLSHLKYLRWWTTVRKRYLKLLGICVFLSQDPWSKMKNNCILWVKYCISNNFYISSASAKQWQCINTTSGPCRLATPRHTCPSAHHITRHVSRGRVTRHAAGTIHRTQLSSSLELAGSH